MVGIYSGRIDGDSDRAFNDILSIGEGSVNEPGAVIEVGMKISCVQVSGRSTNDVKYCMFPANKLARNGFSKRWIYDLITINLK
jgi:hypothetical protein